MKYYAYLKQKGEGCDYTIGCGNTLIDIEAKNDDEARAKLSEIIKEEYIDDTTLSKVILLKGEIQFDLGKVYSELRQERDTENSKRQHIKDMAEFERLKNKLKNK